MKKPLKEQLKKIGGGHLLIEDKKVDDYSNELGNYLQMLRPKVKGTYRCRIEDLLKRAWSALIIS